MLLILFLDKVTGTVLPDILQVLDRTDLIALPVPGIHPFELFTRIMLALEAKFPRLCCHIVGLRAFAEQVRTVLVAGPTPGALAASEIMLVRQVPAADGAVDPARCDRFFGYQIVHLLLCHLIWILIQ